MFYLSNGDDYQEPEQNNISEEDYTKYSIPISSKFNPTKNGMILIRAKNVRKALEIGKYRN